MIVDIDNYTAWCILSIFLLQDIYPLCESRSRSVPLYAGDEHPLVDFARASRRKVKIHIRIDFPIVSKKKFKIILSILEVKYCFLFISIKESISANWLFYSRKNEIQHDISFKWISEPKCSHSTLMVRSLTKLNWTPGTWHQVFIAWEQVYSTYNLQYVKFTSINKR